MLASVMGPAFLVLGLSVLIYSKVWIDVVIRYSKDHLSFLPLAFVEMVLGLIVISVHNYWTSSWEAVITVLGWWMFVEAAVYLLAPGTWIKDLMQSVANKNVLMVAGLLVTVLGGFLSYQAFLA